ncbi:SDR family oxidoreductase [Gilvimarinus agarilyticus]|uniref:SDR family oxidoreductase n=1 Tax=Gilvimarinus sp. 2_MG-2023 TaxID=3062666 RepID=UPI001C080498|nr:SDR family oxidoreductase [Gilvimarinus sp. 2_MG-2023]MBU2887726.1 SDR family oxidoreductase [Gilvimarinus agarilyticus]MDO6572373.1 SDR family oxidoreductase [Gilvimarinus sp. 2_MG-2023]
MSHVVITGASRGIGLGLTRQYLQTGHTVIASHRPGSISDELARLNNEYSTLKLIPLDLACDQSINEFADTLNGKAISLLINNAGTTNHVDYGHWSRRDFLDSYTINAAGPALLIQALNDQLATGAKIIQLSSGLASLTENINPTGPFEEYAMSKAALNMLTRRLAVKLAEREIIVAAISPGWVQTDMGGDQAPTSVYQATKIITQSINQLGRQHSGCFFEADLTPLFW